MTEDKMRTIHIRTGLHREASRPVYATNGKEAFFQSELNALTLYAMAVLCCSGVVEKRGVRNTVAGVLIRFCQSYPSRNMYPKKEVRQEGKKVVLLLLLLLL